MTAHERARALQADIDRVLSAARSSTGDEDIRHVRAFSLATRLIAAGGYILGAVSVNPLAPILITLSNIGRWGLAHQILHCSYDRIPNCPKWLRGSTFARGWRRYWDWCDWILPEGWQHEHNQLHHVNTGGPKDPDIIEANLDFLRQSDFSRGRKLLIAILIMCTWRISYYAPSTLLQLRRREAGLSPVVYKITGVSMFLPAFNPCSPQGRDFWIHCILPNAIFQFIVIPAMALPFGWNALRNLFITQCLAEVLTNAYSWAVIASSHAANDLDRFDHSPHGKAEWYVHQILGTTNYSSGGSFIGWMQAWVNYQIEHHLCPNLTLLQLERIRPRIQAVCATHRIPYVSEPLPRRFLKTLAIMIGDESMRAKANCGSNAASFLERD